MSEPSAPVVMLLEDDPQVTRAVMRILRDTGYQVIVYRSPSEAWLALQESNLPDAIICDGDLGCEKNGRDFYEAIQRMSTLRRIPFIAFTGSPELFAGLSIPVIAKTDVQLIVPVLKGVLEAKDAA